MALFNEILVSLYLYLLMALAQEDREPEQEIIGWGLLSTVFLSMAANIVKTVVQAVSMISTTLKSKRRIKYLKAQAV